MVSITYKQELHPVVTEVFTDRIDLARMMCIDIRTLNKRLREGSVRYDEYRLKGDVYVYDVTICEDIHFYGSSRGCPKGENRFIN